MQKTKTREITIKPYSSGFSILNWSVTGGISKQDYDFSGISALRQLLSNEKARILDVIKTEPQQFQLVLLSIINLTGVKRNEAIFTGDIYTIYQDLCFKNKIEVLTPRRVSDILAEFDMLGLISARVISKGRGGRMREIRLAISKNIIEKAKHIINETLN